MTEVLGALVAGLAGGKSRPGDFAPYYRAPAPAPARPRPGPGPLAGAFAFLKSTVPHKQRKPPP